MKTGEKPWSVGLVALVVAVPLALKRGSSAEARPGRDLDRHPGLISVAETDVEPRGALSGEPHARDELVHGSVDRSVCVRIARERVAELAPLLHDRRGALAWASLSSMA